MTLDGLDEFEYLLTELWIGGKAVPASDGGRFDVLDPATGGVVKNGR
jgi:succinate-semialdehyde dehydrogenase / glutarate-semialdehyde dehydrogenase